MRRRTLLGIAASVVALGMVGAATYAVAWDPDRTYEPVPDTATSQVTAAELERVAELRIFFGHMSVGKNIISGLRGLDEAHGVTGAEFVELAVGQQPDRGDGGAFFHALIGENRHPYRKLENFEAMLRGGMADGLDVAMIKFCYIDIRWDTDVDKLFRTYRETMARLAADYPDVRFVHVTAPLTTGPYGIKDHLKQFLGRDDNATRARYNELLRAEYDPADVLDVAAVEATAPDGTVGDALFGGYSSDGAHLNGPGSAEVAVALVRLLNHAGS